MWKNQTARRMQMYLHPSVKRPLPAPRRLALAQHPKSCLNPVTTIYIANYLYRTWENAIFYALQSLS